MLTVLASPFGSPSHRDAHLREYIRIAIGVVGSEALRRPWLRVPPSHQGSGLPERFGLRTRAGRARRVEYAKQITRAVAEQFGIPLPKVAFRFETLTGHAGHVEFRNGVWYVDVDEAYRWDDAGLTAILAHEFAHVVLATKGVRLEPTLRNEELTDTVAALAGFGRILHKVSERTTTHYFIYFTHTITRRLGYLPKRDFASLVSMHRRIAAGVPKRRLAQVVVLAGARLTCLCCGCLVRLPQVDARLRMRCSVCGLIEDLRIRHGYVAARRNSRAGRSFSTLVAALDRFNGFRAPQ